jgi:hypothetical protein
VTTVAEDAIIAIVSRQPIRAVLAVQLINARAAVERVVPGAS